MTVIPHGLSNGGFVRDLSDTLCVDAIPLDRIAAEVGTPAYVYNARAMRLAYRTLETALAALPITVCYAVKANANLAVIRIFRDLGAGADVVSVGEMRRALAAGVPAERIVFSGVGKTDAELAAAVDAGIGQVNVESSGELKRLNALAEVRQRRVEIALRVNPDVDAGTLKEITTGTADDKFGIAIDRVPAVFELAAKLPGVSLRGVAVHIGSQIVDLQPYHNAYRRIADLVHQLRDEGHIIDHVDLGGGLAIPYDREPRVDATAFAAVVRETLGALGCRMTIEPGRYLVGSAGVMLARVVEWKEDLARPFLILDAGMNDLMRPALYKAYHPIVAVHGDTGDVTVDVDVVGPICESTDRFARGRAMPRLKAGSLVAIGAAGAYGAALSSEYNSRPLVPEVLVDGSRVAVVRKRPSFEEMVGLESLPPWMEDSPAADRPPTAELPEPDRAAE
ncbi:MAG: diaminopimelate decarboxylase [Rhodospirillaceae bacterium]|nr:diaminopimelate decarboxylase [Rhodospirillaceae bacterium]MCA8933068.1 diaminopimelate decarboxylase [Rhodospirillaceae bacterium]